MATKLSLSHLPDDQQFLISVDNDRVIPSRKRRRKLPARQTIPTPPFRRVEGPALTPFKRPAELIGPKMSDLLDFDDADEAKVDYDADSDDASFANSLHGMNVDQFEKLIDRLNKAKPRSKNEAKLILNKRKNFKTIYSWWKKRNKPGKIVR